MSITKRIIPCLDVKDGRTVKGTCFVQLREAGDPVELGEAYSQAGADELVYLDITASHEGRRTAGLNNKKRVCIVSKDYDRIRRYIIDELVRGCTLYEVTGGYTNEKSIELESLLTKDEFVQLMAFINQNEIKAFITAGNVSEVYGLWLDKKHIKTHADKR